MRRHPWLAPARRLGLRCDGRSRKRRTWWSMQQHASHEMQPERVTQGRRHEARREDASKQRRQLLVQTAHANALEAKAL
jgi:hypothetical protein